MNHGSYIVPDLSQIPIGRFSLLTQLTPKALRLYDKKGLLVPEEKDAVTGYRYYTLKQVPTGIKIKLLVTLGFGIGEIAMMVSAAERGENGILRDKFSQRLAETQLEIQRLKKVEEILVNKEKTLELFYERTTEPVIKEVPSLRVLSRREKSTFHLVPVMVGEIMGEIACTVNQRNFVKVAGPVMFICHEVTHTESEADFEIAVPISGRVMVKSGKIELRNLPGGRVVSSLYTGPYEEIGPAYTRTHEYVIQQGFQAKGSPRELYITDPRVTPPEELLTEFQIPIE